MGGHSLNVGQAGVGVGHQAVVHVDHLFGQDDRSGAEGEVVQGGGHGALERVLLAHHAEARRALVHAIEHLIEGGTLDQRGIVDAKARGEAKRRLVAVRALRAEKSDGMLV